MLPHGFLRVAAASPELRVADPAYNAARTLDLLKQAEGMGCDLVVFPELGLTGYTCGDLFHDRTLQRAAVESLVGLLGNTTAARAAFVVGLPLAVDGRLFNVAVVCQGGEPLAVVPKAFLPTYREFYDTRYFAPASATNSDAVVIGDNHIPFGTKLLVADRADKRFALGVEVCEDLWVPTPPSGRYALAGATVLVNLSASPETVGKAGYRRQLVLNQSARCIAGYVYAGAGPGESSQDLVFGGHCLIAENGTLLAESERFRRDSHVTVADLDLDRLDRERAATNTFHDPPVGSVSRTYRDFGPRRPRSDLRRPVDPRPFVPSDPATLDDRCAEIFATQVSGLMTRLAHVGKPAVAIGVSGGLDSTLALLVACKAFDALGEPRNKIRGLTMPGFGTTSRTRNNADLLMDLLGTSRREADIRPMALDQMRAIGHAPFGIPLDGLTVEALTEKLRSLPADRRHDLTFENTQARVRTSLLMNTGFVIGTGDLSELAVGWCTYNADHMSMYNPNVGVPKTLVSFLVRWAARTQFDGPAREVLVDVADTVISPELLPVAADGSAQATEDAVGPYELIDFFLYHFLRWGTPPEKILFLAGHATFSKPYTPAELKHWLKEFLRRFFSSQFKRSALPDGPKVGSVTLSPRGDWRMPSDASAAAWLKWAE
jgi:NAD+ synthase (glutamine-hydrolysing)